MYTIKRGDNMSTASSEVILKEGMHFEGELDGFKIQIDSDKDYGGKEKGPKPKGLMLTALAGCTAMDVISILRKMRAEPEGLRISCETELTEEHPKVFKKITVTYFVKGDVPLSKVERAV